MERIKGYLKRVLSLFGNLFEHIKDRRIIALIATVVLVVAVVLVLVFVVFPGKKGADIYLSVKIYDKTETTSSKKLQVWLKGMGYWGPELKRGWNGTLAGPLQVNKKEEIRILPDGNEGKEIKTTFVYKSNMKSRSDRDAIVVEVYDDKVVFSGTPIEGKKQEFPR